MEHGAKIIVLSFHSGEDRIVKKKYKENLSLEVITKKPILPSLEEIKKNPRARSVKLRAAIKNEKSRIQTI